MSNLTPAPLDPDRLPWEMQPGENARTWQNFCHYRNMTPPRSLARAARELGKSKATIESQSVRWHWQERVQAYDQELDRRYREARETEAMRATQLEAQVAMRGVSAIANRLRDVEATTAMVNDASLGELAVAFEKLQRARRLSHGQPTDFLKGQMQMSPDEARKLFQGVMDIGLMLMPDETGSRFVQEVRVFLETGRLPWG